MYRLISNLLLHRKLRFERGKIVLLGQPMVFIPLEYLIEETKRILEEKNFKEMMMLYLDAWKAGVLFMRSFVKQFRVRSFADRYTLAMEIVSMAGFGDYKTMDFDSYNYAYFEIINNPLAEAFYPYEKPVDFILRGSNAGGGSIVHERIINTLELECKAVSGRKCVHLNASTPVLQKFKDQKLVKEQLDLKWLIPRQIEFIKKIKATDIIKIYSEDTEIKKNKNI